MFWGIEKWNGILFKKMKIETYMRELDIGRSRVCLGIKKIIFFLLKHDQKKLI